MSLKSLFVLLLLTTGVVLMAGGMVWLLTDFETAKAATFGYFLAAMLIFAMSINK